MNIRDKAMLVSLSISVWLNQARDRSVVQGLVKRTGAEEDVHRYRKILVHPDALKEVNRAQGALKAAWRAQTLPWGDGGIRLLPSPRFAKFSEEMRGLQNDFEASVSNFARAYPKLQRDAEKRLGQLFHSEDFPHDIKTKFGARLNFSPIPDASDFRVKLSGDERDELAANVEQALRANLQGAMEALVAKMNEAVAHLAERMREKDPVVRDALVANVKLAAQEVDAFNAQLFADKKIELLSKSVAQLTSGLDVQELREQPAERKKLASKADDILAKMAGYIGGAK